MLDEIVSSGICRKDAIAAIKVILPYLEGKIIAGEEVNFGIFKLTPVTLSPLKIQSSLPTASGNFIVGGRIKWKMSLSMKWKKQLDI